MRETDEDVFDPAHFAKVALPLEDAEGLPRWCFTSHKFFEREVDRIFMKSWIFVGRADEISKPGDFFTLDIANEPLIIIRDDRGIIHALANTCQHRGARMLSGSGNCGAVFSCPYHAWTYANDGQLVGAPAMNTTRNFDKAIYGLPQIRIEDWEGFLFVNFDSDGIGLRAYLGDLPEQFASYRFSDMVLTRRVEYDLDCNWKIYAENSTEIYHTSVVHAGSLGNQEADLVPSNGNWTAIHMPGDETCAVLPEDNTTFPQISTLSGRCKTGTHFCLVYPCVTLCCTHDCMWWLAAYPIAPGKSRLSVGSCFPKSTFARADFAEVVQKYYRRWDKATPEDNAVTALQQSGLRSTLRRSGRMSWKEPSIHEFAMWVKDHVIGNDARA
jgi:choline monooxygenase